LTFRGAKPELKAGVAHQGADLDADVWGFPARIICRPTPVGCHRGNGTWGIPAFRDPIHPRVRQGNLWDARSASGHPGVFAPPRTTSILMAAAPGPGSTNLSSAVRGVKVRKGGEFLLKVGTTFGESKEGVEGVRVSADRDGLGAWPGSYRA